jgi:hypothetical protein
VAAHVIVTARSPGVTMMLGGAGGLRLGPGYTVIIGLGSLRFPAVSIARTTYFKSADVPVLEGLRKESVQ